MSDLLERVFDEFADATEQTVQRLAEQVATLRAELAAFREERAAATTPPPAVEVREGPAGRDGEPGAPGQDGRGVASAELRGGDLIFRFTDGAEVNVGRVAGEQGPPGERGADGLNGRDGEPGPAGERGERGEDGIASREEIEALVDARFADVQTRTLADTYRGVWKAGEKYRRGETATWGGSLFLALSDTGGKPTETTDWQQITKRGRDGRDAR